MTGHRRTGVLGDIAAPFDRLLRGVGRWAERNPQAFEMIAWALNEIAQPARREEVDLRGSERLMRRLLPANWLKMRIGLQNAARKTMAETGICLAWVPRPSVIATVVAADSQAGRDAALLSNEAVILEDLDLTLSEVTSPDLADLVESARQALAAYHAGLTQPAQALAGAAMTTVLADHFGEDRFREARERLTPPMAVPMDLRLARRAMLEWCLLAAIAISYTEPSPRGFNRHLTVHRVGPEQYTDANALAGLMLLVGLLRELHEVYAIGDHGIPLRLRERRLAID